MQDLRVAVTGNRKGVELVRMFERHGATVLHGPTLSGDVPADDDELVADTRAVLDADPRWFVATTGVGMRLWSDAAARAGLHEQLAALAARARCVARGSKAVGGLAGLGATADWMSPNNTDRDVVSWLRQRVLPGDTLVAQLHGGVSTAYERLVADGVDLLTVMPYRWELPEDTAPARAVVAAVIAGELDVITFTSAGAVANLFAIADTMGDQTAAALRTSLAGAVAVASVGPVTAEAVEAHGGINTIVPRRWRMADLVRGTELWWQRHDDVATDLGLRLVPDRSSVVVGDREVELGPREYAVLAALSRRPGVLVRADELVTEAWGHEAPTDAASVKHQVARLRRKLAHSTAHIETVRGVGYRMEVRA